MTAHSEPHEIGSFSWSTAPSVQHLLYHDDRSGLRELHRRGRPGQTLVEELFIPLDKGRPTESIQKNPGPGLELLLHWMQRHPHSVVKHSCHATIICWRDVLHKVIVTPYERLKGWIIYACNVDGQIYLSLKEPGLTAARSGQSRDAHWQRSFQHYMTSPPQRPESLPASPSTRHFCSVTSTTVGSTTVISGGVVVCFDPGKLHISPPQCYVQLHIEQRADEENLWRKLWDHSMRSIWAECFLSGTPKVIIGYHDQLGHVSMTEELRTAKIPALTKCHKQKENTWSDSVCLGYLRTFADLVTQTVTDDYNEATYTFEWDAVKSDTITVERLPNESQHRFLPAWYLAQPPSPPANH
ncbi:decapping and exoribonuclease protein-like [Paramacrobiotus metropolitanus]|uniref:decapping and exoribonuclease protein-like n=1 Tax=Paramacrobiotus metropolitanus TaxID=2943436 RepID=UPI002446285F|nr:decapping and exoribonuclease protein-like [Paramacrobiotus metropolitanus]